MKIKPIYQIHLHGKDSNGELFHVTKRGSDLKILLITLLSELVEREEEFVEEKGILDKNDNYSKEYLRKFGYEKDELKFYRDFINYILTETEDFNELVELKEDHFALDLETGEILDEIPENLKHYLNELL